MPVRTVVADRDRTVPVPVAHGTVGAPAGGVAGREAVVVGAVRRAIVLRAVVGPLVAQATVRPVASERTRRVAVTMPRPIIRSGLAARPRRPIRPR